MIYNSKTTKGKHRIFAKDNIEFISAKKVSIVGKEGGVVYGTPEEAPKLESSTTNAKVGPWFILHGSRIKGRNAENKSVADDLKYNDYTEYESGIKKLRQQLYHLEYSSTKDKDDANELADDKIKEIRKYLKKNR